MIKIKKSEFIKSIGKLEERPRPFLPEFAFAGRSNVGKSSLINCILNRQNIARVSKSPGKTRSINYIKVNEDFYVAHCPERINPGDKEWDVSNITDMSSLFKNRRRREDG